MNHWIKTAAGIFVLLLLGLHGASAHTTLKTSVPAEGAVLVQAPSQFELSFNGEVRLVGVELVSGGGERLRLQPPRGAAAHFVLEVPQLTAGQHSLEWTALGADGHTMRGSISFRLD